MKQCKKCFGVDFSEAGRCRSCQKQYSAKWYAENSDKSKLAYKKWVQANPDKKKATDAEYRLKNSEKSKARDAAYYQKNIDARKAQMVSWAAANRDLARERASEWAKNNKDLRAVHRQNRRARKQLSGGCLSKDIVNRLLVLQKGRCACCRHPLGDKYHLDHINPLALGGSNVDSNMQLLHAYCNLQKSDKHPVEFMQERGYLL